MTREIEVDATGVSMLERETRASCDVLERTWEVQLACGGGGIRWVTGALGFNDVLRDSAILEPGDLAWADFTGPPPARVRVLRHWYRVRTVAEARVVAHRPGAGSAILVLHDEADQAWLVHLDGARWRQLCTLAVREVAHPYFEALRGA